MIFFNYNHDNNNKEMVKTKEYAIEYADVKAMPKCLNKRLKKDELRLYKRSFTKQDKNSIKVSIKWLNHPDKTDGIFSDLSRLSQHMTITKIFPPIRKHNNSIKEKLKNKSNSPKKAILYTRTSSRKVDNKEVSLSYQVTKSLEKSCKKRNANIELLLEHNGVSGMSNHKRNDFQDTIFSPNFLEENNIEFIMVDTIERLTRNYMEFHRLIYMCHHHIKLDDDYTNMNLLNLANHKQHKTIVCTSDGRDSKNDYEYFVSIIEKAEKEHRRMCRRASRFHNEIGEKQKFRGQVQENDSDDDEYNDSDEDILNDDSDDDDSNDDDSDDNSDDNSNDDDSDNDSDNDDDSDNDVNQTTGHFSQLKSYLFNGRRHSLS